ncbi:MAG: UDP-N-acetylglucosamine--N-acetylmuramyl-(pentapeptide) pyrophosphoryl-undecaprenol N-acetylglucosamine transferase [Chloroflexi bacterium]|nr:UDP-N-acetylglucosamine--N-acetylmuramyl-(pentapeptide) pyrophosphoryl-undecaprenol N-acetylglucosamine transferase [Chloroflexota bacterium]
MYPAETVLQALGDKAHPVLWVGAQGGMEADLVARFNVPFTAIPAAGVHGVGLRALPGNVARLVRGFFAASRILRQFKPDAILYTGGYVAAPVALAGWRVPSLLYVPDIEPGLALKFISRFAHRIAVTTPDSARYFNRPVTVTGYPIRPELAGWERHQARQHLGLDDQLPVLLVFGGSKGAQTINLPLIRALPELLQRYQLVHISGTYTWPQVEQARQQLPVDLARRYHAFPYLHDDMGAALASADLVVSRAGASTLGELPHFGLPAILIPYPFAWRYQKVNAEYLAAHGAAVVLENDQIAERLVALIHEILSNPSQLRAMQAAMRSLASPDAAQRLASELASLAGEQQQVAAAGGEA